MGTYYEHIRFYTLAILVAAGALPAWGAASPYIGYVYPAGGQQGTVVHITVGGQNINDVRDIDISGTRGERDIRRL